MIISCDDEMWNALQNRDSRYDGVFYYGVKTTGIFCRPSCNSKVPNRENVVFFRSINEALDYGFRPCKRCRPDLEVSYRPNAQIVENARTVLEKEYADPFIAEGLADRFGVSRFHFLRLFKKHTGYTPKEYVTRMRVIKAQELLKQGEISNTEIGWEVGFKSLSNFYATFRKQTGLSPKEFQASVKTKRRKD